MTTARPLPQDVASPAQHRAIINCVCHELRINAWQSPDMTKVAAYLNSRFNLNLDAELDPLSKVEAHRILDALLQH